MNWPCFLIAALIAAALDGSLLGVLRVGDARPSLLMVVCVFVLLNAPQRTAFRAVLVAGLMADLLTPIMYSDATVLVVVGPQVLAFALGAATFLSFRNLLYRKSPIALGFGTCVFAILVALGGTSVFVLRSFFGGETPWGDAGSASSTVLSGFVVAGLTAILGALVLPQLHRTRALWAFDSTSRLVGGAAR